MTLQLIRTSIGPEHVGDLEQAIGAVFAELDATRPPGLRYASTRLADGTTFLILLEIADGAENPLPGLASFRAFQAGLPQWLAVPPVVESADVVGSYRVF